MIPSSRLFSGSLRQEHEADENEDGENRGGGVPAQGQPASGERLVEQISHGCPERPRQDERRTEQNSALLDVIESIETEPSDRYRNPSVAINNRNRIEGPPT